MSECDTVEYVNGESVRYSPGVRAVDSSRYAGSTGLIALDAVCNGSSIAVLDAEDAEPRRTTHATAVISNLRRDHCTVLSRQRDSYKATIVHTSFVISFTLPRLRVSA